MGNFKNCIVLFSSSSMGLRKFYFLHTEV